MIQSNTPTMINTAIPMMYSMKSSEERGRRRGKWRKTPAPPIALDPVAPYWGALALSNIFIVEYLQDASDLLVTDLLLVVDKGTAELVCKLRRYTHDTIRGLILWQGR